MNETILNHIKLCKKFKDYIPGTSRCKKACAVNDCCLTCNYFPRYCKSKWPGKLTCHHSSFFIPQYFGKYVIAIWWRWVERIYPKIKSYLNNLLILLYFNLLYYYKKVKDIFKIKELILISKRALISVVSYFVIMYDVFIRRRKCR